MKTTPAAIPDVLLIQPKVFADNRGFFYESFNQKVFNDATGLKVAFVQDCHSQGLKGVLRGMHYQSEQPQGKLVRVVRGVIQDVVVDLRPASPYKGQFVSNLLAEGDHRMVWIPPGFAHGFLTLSDTADVLYKTTDYYAPQFEHCLAWDDPSVGIAWQTSAPPILSTKDQSGMTLAGALLTVQRACP
jgi:dTDP-4-dehydrorhamnose 3,5-epimerase